MNNLILVFMVLSLASSVCTILFMRTMMRWQKTQDEMILKLIDGRRRDLEREIAHLSVSGGINKATGEILKRLEP